MATDPILDIQKLVVRYDARHTVLDGLSLEASRGERIAILGPSGTGKTTLFRAIGGFAPIASGTIHVAGTDVGSARRKRLRHLRSRIGLVSQRHDLVDRLRVYQNVMAGALGRWSSARALRFLLRPTAAEMHTAEDALRRVGLETKLRSPTAELSGGQHQRVAIARTLVQEPLLLLADEPVASLDPALAEQVLALLCSLAEENRLTLLCSLHQPQLAERYFGRIVELGQGGIVVADRDLTAQPPDLGVGI